MNNYVRLSEKMICSHCGHLMAADEIRCGHCGKRIGLHSIVLDGSKFGIAVKNRIRIHGLELERARELVSILNIA